MRDKEIEREKVGDGMQIEGMSCPYQITLPSPLQIFSCKYMGEKGGEVKIKGQKV